MIDNSTISFELNESILVRIGSTWILDSIYMFIISPLGLIGFALNLICFIVLIQIKVKETKLYELLRVYSLNSSIICLICGFMFISYSPRYFKHFADYFAGFYRCRVFIYGVMSLYFFGNCMDILICLDRLSIFVNSIKKLKTFIKWYNLFLFFFIICLLINGPILFSFDIMNKNEFYNSNETSYCLANSFLKTKSGFAINMVIIIIRDILTLICEIIASLFTLKYFKSYSSNKISVLHNLPAHDSSLSDGIEHNNKIDHKNEVVNVNNNRNSLNSKSIQKGKNIMKMTVILSLTSIISHSIVAIVFVLFVNIVKNNTILVFSMICLGSFSLCLKHFLNIFIFYSFNFKFQDKFKKIMKI